MMVLISVDQHQANKDTKTTVNYTSSWSCCAEGGRYVTYIPFALTSDAGMDGEYTLWDYYTYKSFDDFSKHNVTLIQPSSSDQCDVELRTICVFTSVSHS